MAHTADGGAPTVAQAKAVGDAVREALDLALTKLADGAREDIQRFAVRIADHASGAVALNNVRVLDELVAQSRALAELERLRLARASWDVFEVVVEAVLRTALRAAGVLAA